MPTPVTSEYRTGSRTKTPFLALYSALIILSLHWAVVLYINSSFLEQFVSSTNVGILFTVSALLTIVLFLLMTRMLGRFGNYRLILWFAGIECLALFGMAFTTTPYMAIGLFIVHQAVVPLILFCLDIFMEEMIGEKEEGTGSKRGLLLGIMSLMGALASLTSGYLIGDTTPHFSYAYMLSAILLIPFCAIIMYTFRTFKDPHYPSLNLLRGFTCFWGEKDVRNVFFAHFILQLFFTWMVIYTPIYLATEIGFSWEDIGKILSVGLLAYVFLEYPVGIIADKWLGEKEMMAFGFLVIVVSTSWFIFLDDAPITLWMIAMFMTRVGASFVETTTESYFFKHTAGKDSNLMSFFRITRPLSVVVGAVLGSLTLYLLPFNLLFLVLGLLMIPGLFFTMALKDTK